MNVWMDDREVKLIEGYLNPEHIMLEWGCGGSTLHFSHKVKKYYSIEHDHQWYETIKNQIPDNVTLIHKGRTDIPWENYNQSEYKHYKEYIDVVDEINEIYNVVLIDGRARRLCALKVIPYINEDSIIFVHDYFIRTAYHCIMDYYDLIEMIDDTPQTIGVFKLKRDWNEVNGYTLNLGTFERL